MGSFSIFHWLLVLAVILIIFGAGKLPSVMGDLAKGIKAFRSGMKDEADKAAAEAAGTVPPPAVAQVLPAGAAPHAHAAASQPAAAGSSATPQAGHPASPPA